MKFMRSLLAPTHLAILGLLTNSLVWGLSWIGFKSLNAQGIHPLWLTAIISSVACVGLCLYRPADTFAVLRHRDLRWVALAAGLTNICFNTAITMGDVLRVTLLFYLMPIWAALLAHWGLNERINRWQSLRLVIGLMGACLVLWQPTIGLPVPSNVADWLGIAGGVFFAANNVGLRKATDATGANDVMRSQAMFMGGATCSMVLAIVLASASLVAWPNLLPSHTVLISSLEVVLWVALFLVANYGVQYGAARLPANLTALIMLSEIFIAGISNAYWGTSHVGWQEWLGGSLILLSPFLFPKRSTPRSHTKCRVEPL
jgi:drug/metabolite transporter (DMT)-like permease